MDSGLRWNSHITYVKDKTGKFINILKWIAGSTWGISPTWCINFVNATVRAQIEWGSFWYVNSAGTYFSRIERLLALAYKIALGIPRFSPNRVVWKFSNQVSIRRRIAQLCDKYVCKTIQLRKTRIINKLKFLTIFVQSRNIAPRNIPYILSRFNEIYKFSNLLYLWDLHPAYSYPLNLNQIELNIDTLSGRLALTSGDPNRAFLGLTNLKSVSAEEIRIFTDGSRLTPSGEGCRVGCAIWIPKVGITLKFKLNDLTSSFAAEAFAIAKAIDFVIHSGFNCVNICTDSLSCLNAIESGDFRPFPLCNLIRDVKVKLLHAVSMSKSIRFTWCPAHKGIQGNELVDNAAKDAALLEKNPTNKIDYRQALSSMKELYLKIDENFLTSINIGTGEKYMSFLSNINVSFLRKKKCKFKRRDLTVLNRIITGYAYSQSFLFKIGVSQSPACACGFEVQNLDHIFLACPMHDFPRSMLFTTLFAEGLLAPFSLIYIINNINLNIAGSLIKFISESKLTI
ncbi:uncharacterized protein LOC118647082 [Monomorium pharaonis]|uniref:uncharacterized protein LOC118647082 n=1 Tax=Monomorium pharaonis TaxID=307658 RepID=UPI001745EA63|nr:uncharacterized protein LOC118647082 [Monomorium pharaonis]